MRLSLAGCFLAGICLGAPGLTGAQTISVAAPSVRQAIAAAVERDRASYGGRTPVPGVLIGVWDAKGGAYIHGFGYADVAKRIPLTADDHFRIGSNTKTFVVATILQLVDAGKLTLDDPISRFNIGVTVPNAQNITIRQLCNMRSGLFEAYNTPQFERLTITPSTKVYPRTLIQWAVQQKPYFPPGRGFHYSNTNYHILGLIIEDITHDSVADQVRKRFIVPFHLTQTTWPTTQAMPDPYAHGYGLDKQRNWEDVSSSVPVSLMGAAGAMISDMADMKRWIKLIVTGKTSSAAMHRALMNCVSTSRLPGQGFGLAMGCTSDWFGYTGGLPGYNTANFYFPESGATIVAYVDAQVNRPDPGVANAIFRDIARILTPDHVPFPKGARGI
jgi:D-alanyl-D-alanine carboxypeptidase